MSRQLLKTVINQIINNKPTISSQLPLVAVNIINEIFSRVIDQFQTTIHAYIVRVIWHDNQRVYIVTGLFTRYGADEQVLLTSTKTLVSEEVLVKH